MIANLIIQNLLIGIQLKISISKLSLPWINIALPYAKALKKLIWIKKSKWNWNNWVYVIIDTCISIQFSLYAIVPLNWEWLAKKHTPHKHIYNANKSNLLGINEFASQKKPSHQCVKRERTTFSLSFIVRHGKKKVSNTIDCQFATL